jgi:biopolymer transport protein ExbD
MSLNKRRGAIKSDINIAPFTDVILVLLIIFMIATPVIMQPGIEVNIPKTETADSTNSSNIIEVTISKEENVYIGGKLIGNANIENVVRKLITEKPGHAIVIKGDEAVQYDCVMQFMDKAKKAGAAKFALAVTVKTK